MPETSEETFLQKRLRLKAEREAIDRPQPMTVGANALSIAADSPRAAAWVRAKLDAQLEQVANAPEGERNHTLNAAAYSLGRLIPTYLNLADVGNALLNAAIAAGLDIPEARATINSGLTSGMEAPRDVTLTDEPGRDLASLVHGHVAVRDTQRPVDPDTGNELSDEQLAKRAHEARVHLELVNLRARHDAKTLHTAELAASTFRVPVYTHTLTDELQIPDLPVQFAVEDLLPAGGNALLAAQYKSGKTTLVMNLLRAYADNQPFLGRFTVTPGPGRIAFFNYELSDSLSRRWLRDMNIVNTDRVSVLNLRGYRLPLTAASVEDWIVGWLREHDITFWVADPFARAATGIDENSNTEVGVWLDTFDVIKERAGISEAVLPTHTGREKHEQGQERARGATRLDDWADVRWLMSKDEDDKRYFRATGRDVDLAEELLSYEETTRTLSYGGGDRRWVARRELEQRVLDFINATPGCSVRAIEAGVQGKKEAIASARSTLIRGHKVRLEDGPNNAQLHYANEVQA